MLLLLITCCHSSINSSLSNTTPYMYVIIFTNPSYAPPHKNENLSKRDLGKLKSHKTSKSQLFIILFLISFHFFFSKQIQNTPHCPRRYYRDPDTTDDEAMDEESTNSPLLKIKWRPQERTTVGGLGESKLNGSSSNKLLAGRIASFKSLKHLLLLLVLLMCRLGVVECVAKLPNGDGAQGAQVGSFKYTIHEWLNSNTRSSVVTLYGPIEDWDLSDVTNMQNVMYDLGSFNADISKWNTSQVTNMNASKCASLLLLFQLI